MSLTSTIQIIIPHILFLILSIVGAASTSESISLGLFITIIVISAIYTCFVFSQKFLFQKVIKSRNSYQINAQSKSGKASGLDNAGFDKEKSSQDTKNSEKWASNYVPYGQYPSGTNTSGTKEVVGMEEGEKWKNSYVPYQEEDNKNSQ